MLSLGRAAEGALADAPCHHANRRRDRHNPVASDKLPFAFADPLAQRGPDPADARRLELIGPRGRAAFRVNFELGPSIASVSRFGRKPRKARTGPTRTTGKAGGQHDDGTAGREVTAIDRDSGAVA